MAVGSPPRAWGRRLSRSVLRHRRRFTPTCVGTTTVYDPDVDYPTVHPHVRGDDMQVIDTCFIHPGSPPRAWGRRNRTQRRPVCARFTPTCVGTTCARASGIPQTPVHPHVRGDDLSGSHCCITVIGSPPRAWGRPPELHSRCRSVRFTPTCVGTTITLCADLILHFGSPPRAWGRLGLQRGKLGPLRFTPTCVGTTYPWRGRGRGETVHPHVRGDDHPNCTRAAGPYGSPPRAWGRRVGSDGQPGKSWFTPTCVGTTDRAEAPAQL